MKTFAEFINEMETTKYSPPKYLVSPALDPEGNQTPDDKMVLYMEDELEKRKKYYNVGISSTNPPKKNI
jgi:hypothetical protein